MAAELGGVVLDVTNVDQLVLQLGDLAPGEAAFGAVQVESIDGLVDHVIAP